MWDFPQIVMMDSITVTGEFPFYFRVPDIIKRRKSRKLNKTQREKKNANSKLRILLYILLTLFSKAQSFILQRSLPKNKHVLLEGCL